ncbi:MAG: metallophosphoesterase, partial [Bacteroidales bacterium]|nr:metallophosphoesterase [Bacteroidales bacterium]
HIVAREDASFYISYGIDPNSLNQQSSPVTLLADQTVQIVLTDLKANTTYTYRLWRRPSESDTYMPSDLYTFHTQRLPGSAFTFVVQADSHLDEQSIPELYEITLANAQDDQPDFLIDLGDTFMTDKLPEKSYENIQKRYLLQRSYFSLLCHSCPLYLVLGNHDGETGWDQTDKDKSLFQWSLGFRKQYFANPEPDTFYTGSDRVDSELGHRQNYYAWHWGDALFVVLDPYANTQQKPSKSNDGWGFTLGESQYQWFAQTLKDSPAVFKFVFCHQVVGGDEQGRGGTEWVPYYEMGGHNTDGTWGFDTHRSGWAKPIHDLMVEHNVSVFFHGHDHFFAKQDLDGIIYQLVPQPSHHNYKRAGQAAAYGYMKGEILPNSGHLRIEVQESVATVDYIRAFLPEDESSDRRNGMNVYSYSIHR